MLYQNMHIYLVVTSVRVAKTMPTADKQMLGIINNHTNTDGGIENDVGYRSMRRQITISLMETDPKQKPNHRNLPPLPPFRLLDCASRDNTHQRLDPIRLGQPRGAPGLARSVRD